VAIIKIIPLQFPAVDMLEKMLGTIGRRFRAEAHLSTHPMDLSPYFDPVRSQYNANEIIQKLNRFHQEDGKVLGITELDLFIPVLSYIFGQAYLGGSAALVSGHRLHNQRYGLPEDEGVYAERLMKCMIHELGHAHGLKHCLKPGCVMVATTYVEEMDQKSDTFCYQCQDLLSQLSSHRPNAGHAP